MPEDKTELKNEELENVNGGMKIIVDEEKKEELSWWESIVNFFFKIK